jgi:hypothetical protein
MMKVRVWEQRREKREERSQIDKPAKWVIPVLWMKLARRSR